MNKNTREKQLHSFLTRCYWSCRVTIRPAFKTMKKREKLPQHWAPVDDPHTQELQSQPRHLGTLTKSRNLYSFNCSYQDLWWQYVEQLHLFPKFRIPIYLWFGWFLPVDGEQVRFISLSIKVSFLFCLFCTIIPWWFDGIHNECDENRFCWSTKLAAFKSQGDLLVILKIDFCLLWCFYQQPVMNLA